jgi:predicted acyltransferase
MSFSMLKYKAIGDGAVLGKVFKRSILIFLIGYLMYWFPFFHLENGRVVLNSIGETRIMGVLQRIAVCYLLASLIIHFLSRQMVYVISALLLIGYWIILLVFGDPADPLSMTGNAGQYIDQYFLGDKHLYHGEGIPFDPEGLLSTLPAIVNVIIGYYAGHFVQRIGISYETIARLLLSGALLILLALSWDMVFPINKKLWTSSFVLLSTGLDLVILAGLIYVSDIKNYNKWNWTRFFLVFGRNALFIYVLSEILLVPLYMISIGDMSLYRWINHAFFQVIAAGSIGSLLFAISYMLFCWLVALILDRKKIYIRV